MRWAQETTAPLARALDRLLGSLERRRAGRREVVLDAGRWDQIRVVRLGLLFAMLTSLVGVVLTGGKDGGSADASPGADQRVAAPVSPTGRAAVPPSVSPVPSRPAARPQLPRGGRRIYPEYRLVAYAGGPNSEALGRLGIGDLDTRVRELERLARVYAAGRTVQPVLEVITVVAHDKPGKDGRYRSTIDGAQIARYLAAARRHRALLLLDIQPGRADFLPEVRALEPWLTEPDVGVALDPEWAVGPGQVPGRVFGSTTGQELDTVADYLDWLVRRHDLPQKVMVVHQLAPRVVQHWERLRAHPGVAVIKSVDGIGPPASKIDTWTRLVAGLGALPGDLHPGFKLFFEEDERGSSRLMTPPEVLRLRPTPEYVIYE